MICHIGTSGWSYPWWREKFYPSGLAQGDWLEFYARQFRTVEINMTFYRFPKPETLEAWKARTPQHFLFTLKANRRITHTKKLKNVKSEVRYFDILADSLGDNLGCLLFQLPPSLTKDLPLLEAFVSDLSPGYRNVIEFRHESWYAEEVFDILRPRNVVFCIVSSAKVPRSAVVTADTAYVRFHGLTGGHRYEYSEEELRQWAGEIKTLAAKECYIYFNNDYEAFAVSNALRLGELLKDG
jgi:uncharacterized protein YecE (DUF72 family)